MNQIKQILLFSCLFAAVSTKTVAQNPVILRGYNFAPIENKINDWIKNGYYDPANIIVAKDNQVILKKSFETYTPETKEYIASAGKWLAVATIAEIATNKDWETLFQEKIAKPLGMKNTHFTPVEVNYGEYVERARGEWRKDVDRPYISKVHVADKGDGTYQNPILHADYSDPDAIRVGEDYYLTASSFAHSPALPILHSKDLVNWTLINHAFINQKPTDVFDKPQHGNGVWAPAFRYHDGWFYIFWGDPDFGIYRIRTRDPKGIWEEPLLIKSAKGWIDPCPFWDENGQAYLSHAFAGSRASFKSVIVIHKMDTEGSKLLDDGVMVFDGHEAHPTVEGTKMYKRNGYYYISAPAGGVPTGWELILRSKNIYGPYDEKIAIAQGKSPTNGPHQGAWITTQTGEDWFLHFQDKGAYGRIVHLEPMTWKNDFPIMGIDADGDGTGEPVLTYKKPNVGKTYAIQTPQESDEFNSPKLGLQWQWQANSQPFWAYPFPSKGFLRLNAVLLPDSFKNYWDVPSLLLQKLPAENFTATTKLTFTPRTEGERVGLMVFGLDYSFLSLSYQKGKLFLSQSTCMDAEKKTNPETESGQIEIQEKTIYMRVKVSKGAICDFSYSLDGKIFTSLGTSFKAKEGKWVGAKVGLFCSRTKKINDAGTADVDWFRVENLD